MRDHAMLRRRIEKLLKDSHLDTSEDEERWQTMCAGSKDMLLQRLSQYGDVEEEITGDEVQTLEMDDFRRLLAEKAAATKHDWIAMRHKQAVFLLPQKEQPDKRYEQ